MWRGCCLEIAWGTVGPKKEGVVDAVLSLVCEKGGRLLELQVSGKVLCCIMYRTCFGSRDGYLGAWVDGVRFSFMGRGRREGRQERYPQDFPRNRIGRMAFS